MKRDWSQITTDGQTPCRRCGESGSTERAHVTGRGYDRRVKFGSSIRLVDPDSIVPLCRACHTKYDRHEIDLLPYLTKAEQVRAVEDLGLEAARIRTAPLAYRKTSQ